MNDAAASLAGPKLRSWFDYPRFGGESCRVLLFEPHYYLAGEIGRALAVDGHEVASIAVPDEAVVGGEWARKVLTTAAKHRPDFVLTVNHFGFDDTGALAAVLDQLRLPTAVWYVDSPEPILRGHGPCHATAHTSLFLWERTLTARMHELGFGHVEHLPLAVDATRLQRPAAVQPRWPIVFVGDSLTETCMKTGGRLTREQRHAAEPAIVSLTKDAAVERDRLLALARVADADPQRQADTIGFVYGAASGRWRRAVLEALPQDQLHVFGDPAWPRMLPDAQHHRGTDYLTETATVYRNAGVVVNVTSRQMPTAVNQRVFDVPAAGGCLLTDAQADFATLFPDADEVMLYHNAEEAREKALWLLGHPTYRLAVTECLHAAIAARHTYVHRVRDLVAAMRSRYG